MQPHTNPTVNGQKPFIQSPIYHAGALPGKQHLVFAGRHR